MLSELNTGKKVVGVKQSRKAIRDGAAQKAFLAEDSDWNIREDMTRLCQEQGVPVVSVPGMKELGTACGIEVGAAVAVLLR